MAHHTEEIEVYKGVSTYDEPSAAWGWHQIGLPTAQIAGVISVFFLLAMNVGNHKGHVETVFLCVFAAVIALLLIVSLIPFHPKSSTRVTAHNKPVGWQERDWAYDQFHLQGEYQDLSDAELRALNIDPATVRRPAAQ